MVERCICGRIIPVACGHCPPQWVTCPCGRNVYMKPERDEYLKRLIDKYKEK